MTWCFLRFEATADVANRLDKAGTVRVGLDLGAKRGDEAIDAARRHYDGVPHTR
jgi:hypothetical protein